MPDCRQTAAQLHILALRHTSGPESRAAQRLENRSHTGGASPVYEAYLRPPQPSTAILLPED